MLTNGRAVWGLWNGDTYLLEPGKSNIAMFDDKAVAQAHLDQMSSDSNGPLEVKLISRGTGIRGFPRC